MRVLNSASITYYQILPDGSKKELNENSNLVETTLTSHASPVKPKITYYTPSSRRFPPVAQAWLIGSIFGYFRGCGGAIIFSLLLAFGKIECRHIHLFNFK